MDVSCRATSHLLRSAEARGVEAATLLRGLDLSEAKLRDVNEFIDWDTFTILLDRAADELGGPDALVDVGREHVSSPPFGFVARLMAPLASPRALYRIGHRWFGASLFLVPVATFEELPDGRICQTVTIPPPARACEAFFHTSKGGIQAAPRLVGAAEASVEMELEERRATFWITLPDGPGLFGRFASTLRSALSRRAVIEELMRQQEQLRHRQGALRKTVQELEEHRRLLEGARQDLERRVADRTEALWRANVDLRQGLRDREAAERVRRELEEQIRQAHKTESLGAMAGGIAHDFNNLLAVVMGQVTLALEDLPAQANQRRNLERALQAARRGADVARQMLVYTGLGSGERQRTALDALVDENLELFRASVPKNVGLRAVHVARGLDVEVDTGHLQQLLMNLILNAAEAVGNEPGSVEISTRRVRIGPDDRELWRFTNDPLPAGAYVELLVQDSGKGIEADELARVFDPFFTTHFAGRGLGLAVVLGSVRAHGGGIAVTSEPGRGTSFRVVLPPAPEPVVETPRTPVVLLLEARATRREALERTLESGGLRVLALSRGDDLVDVFARQGPELDLMLVDPDFPGTGGRTALESVLELDPETPLLVLSDESSTDAAPGADGRARLNRRLEPSELVKRVRDVL